MKNAQMMKAFKFDEYFHTDSWEEANKSFFNQLAPKYDRLNEVISLGQQQRYKRSAVEALKLEKGMRVLDICCGSGDMAFCMNAQCSGMHIDAVDAASAMLTIAQAKADREGIKNIFFYEGSALALPFKDNTFDAIMMSFGLRNLKDMNAGLKEMHRVLKPGGTFISLDLGKPEGKWQQGIYHAYYERLMPWLGKVIFHRHEYNSFAYLSASNKYFPSSEEIMFMLANAGFKNVDQRKYMLGGVAQQIGIK